MDADDIAMPERLDRQIALPGGTFAGRRRRGLVRAVRARVECRRAAGRGRRDPPPAARGHRPFRRRHDGAPEVMRRAGGYDPAALWVDWDMDLRLAAVTRLHNLPEVVIRYRRHAGSMQEAVPAPPGPAGEVQVAACRPPGCWDGGRARPSARRGPAISRSDLSDPGRARSAAGASAGPHVLRRGPDHRAPGAPAAVPGGARRPDPVADEVLIVARAGDAASRREAVGGPRAAPGRRLVASNSRARSRRSPPGLPPPPATWSARWTTTPSPSPAGWRRWRPRTGRSSAAPAGACSTWRGRPAAGRDGSAEWGFRPGRRPDAPGRAGPGRRWLTGGTRAIAGPWCVSAAPAPQRSRRGVRERRRHGAVGERAWLPGCGSCPRRASCTARRARGRPRTGLRTITPRDIEAAAHNLLVAVASSRRGRPAPGCSLGCSGSPSEPARRPDPSGPPPGWSWVTWDVAPASAPAPAGAAGARRRDAAPTSGPDHAPAAARGLSGAVAA